MRSQAFRNLRLVSQKSKNVADKGLQTETCSSFSENYSVSGKSGGNCLLPLRSSSRGETNNKTVSIFRGNSIGRVNCSSSYSYNSHYKPATTNLQLIRNLSVSTVNKMGSFCFWESKEVYKDHFKPGVYCCSECGYELFSSRQKFKHNSPWPAFTETIHEDSVKKHLESPGAYKVRCGKCDNPLGHEFLKDGPEGKSRF